VSQLAETVHFKSLVSKFVDQPVVFCRSTHVRFFLPAFDPFFTSLAYLSDSKSRKSNNQRASTSLHVPAPLSSSLAIPFDIYISTFRYFITDNKLTMQLANRHSCISECELLPKIHLYDAYSFMFHWAVIRQGNV